TVTSSRRKLRHAGERRLAAVAGCIVLAASAVADDGPQELPPSQRSTGDDAAMLAPLGISDARSLSKGEWALSYRYSWIHQDDMRDNSHREST
ncbi:hypothetical protein L9G74_20490, partial [Shewanella sp. C32]